MGDKPTNVLEALRAVSEKIDHIEKGDSGKGISYKFRSIDRVLDACHDPFIEFGITIVPQVVHATSVPHTITSSSGNTTTQLEAQILVNYRVFGPGGPSDFIDAQIFTTSMDPGDKATGKAMSYGYKNLMFQLLCLSAAAEEDNDQASARQASTGPRNAVTTDVNPLWPPVGDSLKALKADNAAKYASVMVHLMEEGIFKSNPKGGFVPNHPLTDDHVAYVKQTVNRVKADKPPVVPEPEPKVADEYDQPPANVSALLAALKPKHSDEARVAMDMAFGGTDYTDEDVTPEMWTLAEMDPGEIDWTKAGRPFKIGAPDMLKIAKQAADENGYDVPRKLDEIENPSLSDEIRRLVLVRAFADNGAPF